MQTSSRTPEGLPNRCPFCDARVRLEPSTPTGNAPCPDCGSLLWFVKTKTDHWLFEHDWVSPEFREYLAARIAESPGELDSLDLIELVMECEDAFETSTPDEDVI